MPKKREEKWPNERIIELVAEIRGYAENMLSVVDDLIEFSDDAEIDELCGICEMADVEVHTWLRDSEIGQVIDAELFRRLRAELGIKKGKRKAA